jgi:hypothetical protein
MEGFGAWLCRPCKKQPSSQPSIQQYPIRVHASPVARTSSHDAAIGTASQSSSDATKPRFINLNRPPRPRKNLKKRLPEDVIELDSTSEEEGAVSRNHQATKRTKTSHYSTGSSDDVATNLEELTVSPTLKRHCSVHLMPTYSAQLTNHR